MNTLLVWDIENVSVKNYTKNIFESLKYKPDLSIAVSKREASIKEIETFKKLKIEYRQSETIADTLILEILEDYKDKVNNFIIITSDSDFCIFLNSIKNKNVQWMLLEQQSFAILQRNKQMKSNNIQYTFLKQTGVFGLNELRGKGDLSFGRKKIIEKPYYSTPVNFSSEEIKRYSIGEKISFFEKKIISLLNEYKLDKYYLQEIIEKYSFSIPKGVMSREQKDIYLLKFEKQEFVIKTMKHRIENYFSQRAYGLCACCGNYNEIKETNFLCNLCNEKFVLEFGKRTETHEVRMIFFQEKISEEKEKYNGIIYPMERIDLLKKELLIPINFPKKIKGL